MTPLSRSVQRNLLIALMLAMTATRFHHVGDWLHLPDASMAVFFVGGLTLRRYAFFALLLGLSVSIDWAAVSLAGVGDFCITAAYAALPLAYGVLWYAGRAYQAQLRPRAGSLCLAWGLGVAAAAVSFLISNGAFYWLGGRYADPHWAQYLQRAAQWGPLFVRTTALYLAVALVGAWRPLRWRAVRSAADPATPLELS
ncbi:hypothetical protein LL965_10555 [Xanthomonas cassavae CFBP 4642]|uniref:Cobalamin ABC transporter n=1 Tax=Xanthomonas cassavae CFBP 4642 TaxID=1219375 RepID=A0ABS8HEB2_9XANT|nr:hypothetical protein [Xanthomonas cassavae]MCC4620504.1 hypothetical protein [Xanthomonas cassavae CFBP 4642]